MRRLSMYNNVLNKEHITENELYDFLLLTNDEFPVQLNEKTDLKETANKLYLLGDIFCLKDRGNIVGLVAGYSNNKEDKMGYISVVVLLNEYRGRGFAAELVKTFLKNARTKGMKKLFLYTHRENAKAVSLYKKLGFYEVDSKRNGDYTLEVTL